MDPTTARQQLVDSLVSRGTIERETTADALRAVPRHEFVPEDRQSGAYDDRPLPIGADQTISAPHIVGMMTDLLDISPGDRVLEIGTGCGYHAAVTAEAVGAIQDSEADGTTETNADTEPNSSAAGRVFSVEYHAELAETAGEHLDRLGYDVSIRVGDGHEGWSEHAPYDAAYLTCAPTQMPQAVVEQVRPGGVVVGPIGTEGGQRLVRLRRRPDGEVTREDHGGVRFVPMQSD